MEFENNQGEVLKEVQNILLRHNSEMKQWYKVYSRKIEVHKSEESFSMTMKQVWRFLRDTHLISANSTIAQFNRVFSQGVKNHFLLLGSKDQTKFDKLYSQCKDEGKQEQEQPEKKCKVRSSSSSSEEEEEESKNDEVKNMDAEDMHDAFKIVLQRQFFEAIVRAT